MRKIVAFILCVFIMTGALAAGAGAAFSDFPDAQNHWAAKNMEQAYNDGILKGYDNGKMGPNDPVRASEVMALITRVLDIDDGSTVDGIAAADKWYLTAVSAAYKMGLFEKGINLDGNLPRQDAFYAIATAFGLVKAEYDSGTAAAFSDWGEVKEKNRPSMASLIEDGFVIGFDGKTLANNNITRAEFVTMLYRIAGSISDENPASGSFVMAQDRLVSVSADRFWVKGQYDRFTVSNVNAKFFGIPTLTDRNCSVNSLTAQRVAIVTRDDFTFNASGGNIGTIAVGGRGGAVNVNARADALEITSDGRSINVTSYLDKIVIAGSNNTVTINSSCSNVIIKGQNNRVIVNRTMDNVTVMGTGIDISGSGRINTLLVENPQGYVYRCTVGTVKYAGIVAAKVEVTAPDTLPVGETLTLKAKVNDAEIRSGYEITWIIDGKRMPSVKADLSSGTEFTYEYKYEYKYDMPAAGKAEFEIKDTRSGRTVKGEASYKVENYPDSHYYSGNILSVVTTGYKGNRTLEWAQKNDYSELEKNLFVNTKGYKSDTKYMIWVSIAYQRVNVFENIGGKWKLIRSSIVGTGKSSTPTPVGVYKTTYKQTGWHTSSYSCFPIVRFWQGTGYAFHSRLYYPGSRTRLSDARIGFPISMGCIRMYDEDIRWLYDNIPTNTTVVVF